MLRRRAEHMYDEKLDLGEPSSSPPTQSVTPRSPSSTPPSAPRSRASPRPTPSPTRLRAWDPDLAECLRLYGDEEGWHRELLTQFLAYLGGEVRPMGRVTGTFYRAYAHAKRHRDHRPHQPDVRDHRRRRPTAWPCGAPTHPAVRQMLTILTRDESFHVPLNVHFLREALAHAEGAWDRPSRPPHGALPPALRRAPRLRRGQPPPRSGLRPHPLRRAVHRATPSTSGACSSTRAIPASRRPARCCASSVSIATRWRASEDSSVVSIQAAEQAVDRASVSVSAL